MMGFYSKLVVGDSLAELRELREAAAVRLTDLQIGVFESRPPQVLGIGAAKTTPSEVVASLQTRHHLRDHTIALAAAELEQVAFGKIDLLRQGFAQQAPGAEMPGAHRRFGEA